MNKINVIGNLMIGLLFSLALNATAADAIWADVNQQTAQAINLNTVEKLNVRATEYRLLNAKMGMIERQLYDATTNHYELMLPLPDGSMTLFHLRYSPVYQPELEQKYPSIRTFKGYQADNPANAGRFDITPHGFHGMFKVDGEQVFIDPLQRGNNRRYISYYKKNAIPMSQPVMDKIIRSAIGGANRPVTNTVNRQTTASLAGETLKTYRLVVGAAGEYTAFHGGTKEAGQAAIVTAINRVNEVYEVDFSIKLELIGNNDTVVYTDAATDPYANDETDINTNVTVMSNNIGDTNFDIGHIVNTAGGGLAGFEVVCGSDKAAGVTGSSSPTNDPFVIDFVAHEIGHQFGGDHTYNGGTGACTTRVSSAAYEPGSGATIMAYAGICGEQNLQSNSDPYFHAHSLDQVLTFIAGAGNCATTTAINNEAPVAAAGNDFTVPKSTPMMLTGSATDTNGDSMTYVWEQFDLGSGTSSVGGMVDDGSRPLFRSWTPTSSPVRYLPLLSDVVANTTRIGETYATTGRTMNFRLTVRDGKGNTATDSMVVTVDSNSGPFVVTAPTSSDTWAHSTNPVVNWDVANTNQAPVSCSTVDILLSTDSGVTFDQTILSATANDGAQAIDVPALDSTTARVQVMCQGNIFFAVNTGDFTINGVDTSGVAPVISGQSALAFDEDSTLTVAFTDLTVVDSDSNYPDGFSMSLTAGSNYSVNGQVITPDADFSGTLTVPVKVNDGALDSNVFELAVTVNPVNDAPSITGADGAITQVNIPVTLSIDLLQITDVDNTTDQMTMSLGSGSNYTFDGLTVTPTTDFSGTLTVPVTVNDGTTDSNTFNVSVSVVVDATIPVITGQNTVTVNEDASLIIALSMLQISDSDSTLDQMTLTVMTGANYALAGDVVTPDANFNGSLTVPVKVNDGTSDSNTFNLSVTVISVNDLPVINGTIAQSIDEEQGLTITTAMLDITDIDNSNDQMRVIVMAGSNYSVAGTTITPNIEFSGILAVSVKVNDGSDDSNTVDLVVNVASVNDAPVITAVQALSVTEEQSITLSTANLTITDADNSVWTMTVMAGSNYSVNGLTVTPDTNFDGTLSVPVKVNDGAADSNIFNVTINITPVNDAPIIAISTEASMDENTSLTLGIAFLTIVDPDNALTDMTLMVMPGDNYTLEGTTITPTADFNGALSVQVKVNDGALDSNIVVLPVTVNAVDSMPIIVESAEQTVDEDQNLTMSLAMLTVVDADTAPDALSLVVLGGDNYTAEGLTVSPLANFNGVIMVNVTVSDGENVTDTHQMMVTVNSVNDAPVAVDDGFTVAEDSTSNSFTVMGNDSDIEDDTLNLESVDYSGTGTANVQDERIVYTPAANFNGTETLTYTISDGNGSTATAQVTITVTPEPSRGGGGGSMPLWLLVALLPLMLIRRITPVTTAKQGR